MYELIQVSQRDYYIQSPAKIGLIQLNGVFEDNMLLWQRA